MESQAVLITAAMIALNVGLHGYLRWFITHPPLQFQRYRQRSDDPVEPRFPGAGTKFTFADQPDVNRCGGTWNENHIV